jgi:hypothetical protein
MSDNDKSFSLIGSILKTGVTATPLAIGAATSLKGALSDEERVGIKISQDLTSTKTSRSFNAIRDIAASSVGDNTVRRQLEQHTARISRMLDKGVLSSKQVYDALQRSAVSVDPTGHLHSLVAAQVGKDLPVGQMAADIEDVMSRHSSIYTQKAMRMFSEDVQVMTERAAANLSVEPVQLANFDESMQLVKQEEKVILSSLPETIQKDIKRIATQLGDAETRITRLSRADLSGSMLEVQFSRGNILGGKDVTLRAAEVLAEDEAMIIHGRTQQSKYIAGRYGIMEHGKLKESFNHTEWFFRRAHDELVPQLLSERRQLTSERIRLHTSGFHQKMMEAPEWVESLRRGVHPSVDEYINQRKQIMRLYEIESAYTGSALDPVSRKAVPVAETGYARLIKKGGIETADGFMSLFPGHSPGQMAKGVFATADPKAKMLFGQDFPTAKRPMQSVRREYSMLYTGTEEAARAPIMGGDTHGYGKKVMPEEFNWAKRGFGIDTPTMHTAYVSEKYHAKAAAKYGLNLAEGGLGLSAEGAEALATGRIKQFDIAYDQFLGLKDKINWGDRANVALNMPDMEKGPVRLAGWSGEGLALGRNPYGETVRTSAPTAFLEATMFEDRNKGKFVRLMGVERMSVDEAVKVFGGAKGMAMRMPKPDINRFLAEVGGMQGADVIATMDELKKNRALHYQQMFTSLWGFSKQNMESRQATGPSTARGVFGGRKARERAMNEFVNSPETFLRRLESRTVKGGVSQHEARLATAMGIAREAKLSPQQMGEVFGAVPEVFTVPEGNKMVPVKTVGGNRHTWRTALRMGMEQLGVDPTESRLSAFKLGNEEAVSIARGKVTGAMQFSPAGLTGPGSGKIGTLEPRLFELLESPHWGSLGPEIQQDIAKRMTAFNPDALMDQRTMAATARSLGAPGKIEGAMMPSAIEKEMLSEKAVAMRLKGIGDVQLPNVSQVQRMAAFRTPEGSEVSPRLAMEMEDFVSQAKLYEKGEIPLAAMKKNVSNLQGHMTKAWAETVTGSRGVLRNRLPGSTFYTAVSPAMLGDEFGSLGLGDAHVGVSKERLLRDVNMMADLGVYDTNKVKHLRKQIKAGQTVHGLGMRHPFISAHSAQAISMKPLDIAGDYMVINERQVEAQIVRGAQDITAAGPLKNASRVTLRMSPLVGWAGDIDGDIVNAMLASPDMQGKMRKAAGPGGIADAVRHYGLRSQVLKAKAASKGVVTFQQAAAADYLSSTIPQLRLGQISEALQKGRAAILANPANLQGSSVSNALGMLEFLEQTPISGKHITPKKQLTGEMSRLLSGIQQAINKKSSSDLSTIMEKVLVEAKSAGLGGMDEGFTVAYADSTAKGGMRKEFVSGLMYRQAAEDIVQALGSFETPGASGLSGADVRSMLRGRRLPKPNEAEALLGGASRMSPYGGFLDGGKAAATGRMGIASDLYMGVRNRAGALGRGMIEHYKPLAIGSAAAIGIGLMLSSPPDSLDPGYEPPPTPPMKSGTGGAHLNTNVRPAANMTGQPTPSSSMEQGNTARVSPGPSGAQVRVAARSRGNMNYEDVGNQISMNTGGANVVSRVHDNRSSLTPQALSDILRQG